LEVIVTIDSRKTKSQRNPFDWTYGVAVKANDLEEELTVCFSGHQIQAKKTRIEEKWITMLAVAAARAVRQLKLGHVSRLKLYVCKDLTCNTEKKRATLIAAVAETLRMPHSSIDAELVTRKNSKSGLELAEQYNRAHRAARGKVYTYCSPQEVEKVLEIVHRRWTLLSEWGKSFK